MTSPAKADRHVAERGTLLSTSGTEDHAAPVKVTEEVVAMYARGPAVTDFHVVEGRGHSLTIDGRSAEVAGSVLEWLAGKGL